MRRTFNLQEGTSGEEKNLHYKIFGFCWVKVKDKDVKETNLTDYSYTNCHWLDCCGVQSTLLVFVVQRISGQQCRIACLRTKQSALSSGFCSAVRRSLALCSLFGYKSVKQHGWNSSPFNNGRYAVIAPCRGLYWKQARSVSLPLHGIALSFVGILRRGHFEHADHMNNEATSILWSIKLCLRSITVISASSFVAGGTFYKSVIWKHVYYFSP
jgi:hypothetical protein